MKGLIATVPGIALLSCLLTVPMAWASVRPGSENKPDPADLYPEPRWQTAAGFAVRTDHRDYHDYVPSISGKFYLFLATQIALTAGLAYNQHTRISEEITFSSLSFTWALRLQRPERLLTPFAELGVSFIRYTGRYHGCRFSHSKEGPSAALGLSIRLGRHRGLDLAFRQVLNHINHRLSSYVDCWTCRGLPGDAYNPTSIDALYRFAL
jgi:hypothetical protein